MDHVVAYHSERIMGVPLFGRGKPPVRGKDFSFFTSKPQWLANPSALVGCRLWAFEGSDQNPARYRLAATGVIEKLPKKARGELTVVVRCDQRIEPRDVTKVAWFKRLFQNQNQFSYGLNKLHDRGLIRALNGLLPKLSNGPSTGRRRALSLRQPWAELVMRGEKKVEYRNMPTNVRERVWIYAGEGRYRKADEAAWSDEHGLDLDALPRGVIVGSVEIVGCRECDEEFEWDLARPERAKRLVRPRKQPQPRFFYPF